AAEATLGEFREAAEDVDDGPIIVLALASLLLDEGVTAHPLLTQASEIIVGGAGLERWANAGAAAFAARRQVYERLRRRLSGVTTGGQRGRTHGRLGRRGNTVDLAHVLRRVFRKRCAGSAPGRPPSPAGG